jgi:hypothetical protein
MRDEGGGDEAAAPHYRIPGQVVVTRKRAARWMPSADDLAQLGDLLG